MKRANTMSTITVELTIKVKTKFTSSNAEKTNGFISPQMSHNFHTEKTPKRRTNSKPNQRTTPPQEERSSQKEGQSENTGPGGRRN